MDQKSKIETLTNENHMIYKKLTLPLLLASCFSLHAEKHLFDGKTLNGWDGKPRRSDGLLAFQVHQGPSMKLFFKNIVLK